MVPFDDAQIQTFNRQWHAWYHHTARDAAAAAEDFWRDLCVNPRTKTLGRIPNVLNIMVNVHERLNILPDGRARLFSLLTEAFLQSIDEQRKLVRLTHPRSTLAEQKLWLGRIAWEVQVRRAENETRTGTDKLDAEQVLLFTHREMVDWISKEQLNNTGNEPDEEEIEGFAQAMQKRAGLIIDRGERLYAFVHLTLMEYYAACALIQSTDSTAAETPLGIDRSRLAGDPIWHEVIQLAFEEVTQFLPRYRRGLLDAIFPHLKQQLGIDNILTGKPLPASGAASAPRETASLDQPAITAQSHTWVLLTRLGQDKWAGFERLQPAIRAACTNWALRVDPLSLYNFQRKDKFRDRWLAEFDSPEEVSQLRMELIERSASFSPPPASSPLPPGEEPPPSCSPLPLGEGPGVKVGRDVDVTPPNTLICRSFNITAAEVQLIAQRLPNLTALDLSFNQIGEAGALEIAQRLPHLTTLSLAGNEIGDAGAREIAQRLTNLTALDLRGSPISEAVKAELREQLSGRIENLYL